MEKRDFCLFVPTRREGYRTLRKRYAVEGGIFALAENILGEVGKVYLFDSDVRVICDGVEVSLPQIEPGTVLVFGKPENEVLGESDLLPEGDALKVTSVARKAVGSKRMHHTTLTLK